MPDLRVAKLTLGVRDISLGIPPSIRWKGVLQITRGLVDEYAMSFYNAEVTMLT